MSFTDNYMCFHTEIAIHVTFILSLKKLLDSHTIHGAYLGKSAFTFENYLVSSVVVTVFRTYLNCLVIPFNNYLSLELLTPI